MHAFGSEIAPTLAIDAAVQSTAPPCLVCCSEHPHHRTNAAVLLGAWRVLVLGSTAADAFTPFLNMSPPLLAFRDAAYGVCTFSLSVLDCLRGLEAAVSRGWFDLRTFDVEKYEHDEQLAHGDINWIIPGVFLAFSGPHEKPRALQAGGHLWSPPSYVKYCKSNNVSMIVRLNKACYNADHFVRGGIKHLDLFYPDGGLPPQAILEKFLHEAAACPSAIGVHCKAGLGRTGTCIGAYMMKHYRVTARECIAWMRLARSGCVLGPQQQYLVSLQDAMWKAGEAAGLHARWAAADAQLVDSNCAEVKVPAAAGGVWLGLPTAALRALEGSALERVVGSPPLTPVTSPQPHLAAAIPGSAPSTPDVLLRGAGSATSCDSARGGLEPLSPGAGSAFSVGDAKPYLATSPLLRYGSQAGDECAATVASVVTGRMTLTPWVEPAAAQRAPSQLVCGSGKVGRLAWRARGQGGKSRAMAPRAAPKPHQAFLDPEDIHAHPASADTPDPPTVQLLEAHAGVSWDIEHPDQDHTLVIGCELSQFPGIIKAAQLATTHEITAFSPLPDTGISGGSMDDMRGELSQRVLHRLLLTPASPRTRAYSNTTDGEEDYLSATSVELANISFGDAAVLNKVCGATSSDAETGAPSPPSARTRTVSTSQEGASSPPQSPKPGIHVPGPATRAALDGRMIGASTPSASTARGVLPPISKQSSGRMNRLRGLSTSSNTSTGSPLRPVALRPRGESSTPTGTD